MDRCVRSHADAHTFILMHDGPRSLDIFLYHLLDNQAVSGHIPNNELGVIRMVVDGRHTETSRQDRGLETTYALCCLEGCSKGLQLQHPQQRCQGAALWQAIADREVGGDVAVDEHPAACVRHEEIQPAHAAHGQPHGLSTLPEPGTVHPIIRLLDIEDEQGPSLACSLQVLHNALGKEHVVCNGAAPEKSGLGWGDEDVKRALKAVGDDPLG
jgi:hypothetical protein